MKAMVKEKRSVGKKTMRCYKSKNGCVNMEVRGVVIGFGIDI